MLLSAVKGPAFARGFQSLPPFCGGVGGCVGAGGGPNRPGTTGGSRTSRFVQRSTGCGTCDRHKALTATAVSGRRQTPCWTGEVDRGGALLLIFLLMLRLCVRVECLLFWV